MYFHNRFRLLALGCVVECAKSVVLTLSGAVSGFKYMPFFSGVFGVHIEISSVITVLDQATNDIGHERRQRPPLNTIYTH